MRIPATRCWATVTKMQMQGKCPEEQGNCPQRFGTEKPQAPLRDGP
jgi:hypothetical protein